MKVQNPKALVSATAILAWTTLTLVLTLLLFGCSPDGRTPVATGADPESSDATAPRTDDSSEGVLDNGPPEADEIVGGRSIAWQWDAAPLANVGMPVVDSDEVAVASGNSKLFLISDAGVPVWEVERVGLRDTRPTFAESRILAATDDGVLAVDRGDGRVLWDTVLGERANTPVVTAGVALVSTWDSSLVALDLETGRPLWRQGLPGPALGPAATDGQVVVVSWESEDGPGAGLLAVDAQTGIVGWEAKLQRGGVSGPTVVNLGGVASRRPSEAVVVVVDAAVAAHGFDLRSGQRRWTTELEGAGSPEVPALALPNREVLVTHRLGGLALLDAASGLTRWVVSSPEGIAVRGGPVGPTPEGLFVLPLDNGRLLVAGNGEINDVIDPPGRVSGVALTSGDTQGSGRVLVATREMKANSLFAVDGL